MTRVARALGGTVVLIIAAFFVFNWINAGGSVYSPGEQPSKWSEPHRDPYPDKMTDDTHVVKIIVQASPTRKLKISWSVDGHARGPEVVTTGGWSRRYGGVRTGAPVQVGVSEMTADGGLLRCFITVDGKVYAPPANASWEPYEIHANDKLPCSASVVVA
jgi:hypothetical protein